MHADPEQEWTLCDIALAIFVREKNTGRIDTTELNRLENEDKLKVLQKIKSNETSILSVGKQRRSTTVFKIVNQQVISYVYNNCWCLHARLGPDYEA